MKTPKIAAGNSDKRDRERAAGWHKQPAPNSDGSRAGAFGVPLRGSRHLCFLGAPLFRWGFVRSIVLQYPYYETKRIDG